MADKATPATPSKGKQLSTTVDPEFYAVLDAHHWDARKKLSDIVREAVYDYAVKNDLPTPGLSEAPEA